MWGAIILGAWVVALCAWMSYGETPHWIRGGLQNLGLIAAFAAICVVVILIVYGPSSI